MKNVQLAKLWDALHSSYWFLPGIIALGAIILAFAMITLDRQIGFDGLSWIYTGGPDGARAVLSVIAGSMVSVAATAFSITIVALQLASANFGPRLLRNFMRDTGNQLVLGTFIATFIYSLIVLRTIYGEDYDLFVPHLSVTIGLILAIVSIGVLIYFIHHASTIIQASHVIESVSHDLDKAIDRLFPNRIGLNPPEHKLHLGEIPTAFELQAYPIRANGDGYLQAIDNQKLMDISTKHNLLIHIKSRPSKFVFQGNELAMAWPGERVNRKLTQQIEQVFILGRERTEQQDVAFPINQLVEIAMRALSPGINDPFTAMRCIDRLCAGLCHLVQREFPSPYRYDEDNKLRVIAEPITFAGMVNDAFNQIRQYGRSDAAVTIHLLEAITIVANYAHNPQDRENLRRHADMIERGSHEGLPEEQDRQDVQEQYHKALQALEQEHEIDR
ncbi:DUF2254 domain-containing protein [Nostocaceae cyanobacterium CENA357]|uniref:DUF2254 domain-containing protein n=1 Tax=Atlanticothrix silvestris CENA357 TaxID=1725252 RepID=A0A8J7HCE9_9CYAN|nr:DUF2254 domain-containing protein [Atlanticothrix silvestris]MBH8552972.1 DUF2254 domain-containing protein [Atlanticothrix silvestris CENA357]